MRMEIEYRNARWLVNGKRLEDMNEDEKNFLDSFFREYKSTLELFNFKPTPLKRAYLPNLITT